MNYSLFPYLTLSETDIGELRLVLPELSMIRAVRPPVIPDWARDRFSARPSLSEEGLAGQIRSCVESYRAFAQVHGGGGALASIALAMEEAEETRLRIQQELRGASPPEISPELRELFEAAVFLEIARDLDEKEFELEAGVSRLKTLEKEFRTILGVSGEEGLDQMLEALDQPLATGRAALSFMLSKRISSWFVLFFNGPAAPAPVFVSINGEAVSELLDHIRNRQAAPGKALGEVARLALGSFPGLDSQTAEQLRSTLEAGAVSERMSAYRRDLDSFIREAADAPDPATMKDGAGALEKQISEIFGDLASPDGPRRKLELIAPSGLTIGMLRDALLDSPRAAHGGNWDFSRPAVFLCVE